MPSSSNITETLDAIGKIADFLALSEENKSNFNKESHKEGSFPRETAHILLKILQTYFGEGRINGFSSSVYDYPKLTNLIVELSDVLNEANELDANYFISIRYGRQSKPKYLAEILVKLFEGNLSDFQYNMKSLAEILVKHDPSLIVDDCPELLEVYQSSSVHELGFGPAIEFKQFKDQLLPCLKIDAHQALKVKIDEFSASLKGKRAFSADIIDGLKQIYAYRWNGIPSTSFKGIKGTVLDYTRVNQDAKMSGVNKIWILVAQIWSGAKLIPPDYYSFLMPTIVNKTHFYTLRSLESAPLSHYVLSSDGTHLIYLKDSKDYYNRKGECVNCSSERLIYLDAEERRRIQYADKRFLNYYQQTKDDLNLRGRNLDLPVKQSTVDLVYQLVTKTLRATPTVNNRTVKKRFKKDIGRELDTAYLSFCESLHALDCRAQVLFSDATAENIPSFMDIADVIALKKVLFINRDGFFNIGYCNLDGQYEEMGINNASFLDGYRPGDYIASRDCCALRASFVPTVDQLQALLGFFKSGYIRVINSEQGLNELYYADLQTRTVKKLNVDQEKLKQYDKEIASTPVPEKCSNVGFLNSLFGHLKINFAECCAINVLVKPNISNLKYILGTHTSGLLRIFNEQTGVNALYYACSNPEKLRLLTCIEEQLCVYDKLASSTSLPESLHSTALQRIANITGHVVDHTALVNQILFSLRNSQLTRLDEERYRFYHQLVDWNGEKIYIKDILAKIEQGDVRQGCTTEYGKYFVKWILDYFPARILTDDIERLANTKLMRKDSKLRTCSDERVKTNADKMLRNQKLMFSLLTHPFTSYLFSSEMTLNFWGCSNTCEYSTLIEAIFGLLKTHLEKGGYTEDLYSKVINEFVVPMIRSGELLELPAGVVSWINLIRNPHFMNDECQFYDLKNLFIISQKLAKIIPGNQGVTEFQDDLISIMYQPKSTEIKTVRANVMFKKLIESFTFTSAQDAFFDNVLKEHKETTHNEFCLAIYGYVKHRMNNLRLSTSVGLGMFGRVPQSQKNSLKPAAENPKWDESPSIKDLVTNILNTVEQERAQTISAGASYFPSKYLEHIKRPLSDSELIEEPDSFVLSQNLL